MLRRLLPNGGIVGVIHRKRTTPRASADAIAD
jgi:hypothetical protein